MTDLDIGQRLRVTVEESDRVWEHPKGEFSIYRLVIRKADGTTLTVSTYNDWLAHPGWHGTITISLNRRGEPMAKPHTRQPSPDTGDDHYSRGDHDWSYKFDD